MPLLLLMLMLRPTTGATAMAIEAMVATTVATEATTVERGTLMPLLLLMLMLMPMLRLTTGATAMATGVMVATTVVTEAMVATTVERGKLMPLLMLMLMPMLRLTIGATAMATGVMVATGATGAVTGARRLHHFQNSVRVLRIR